MIFKRCKSLTLTQLHLSCQLLSFVTFFGGFSALCQAEKQRLHELETSDFARTKLLRDTGFICCISSSLICCISLILHLLIQKYSFLASLICFLWPCYTPGLQHCLSRLSPFLKAEAGCQEEHISSRRLRSLTGKTVASHCDIPL